MCVICISPKGVRQPSKEILKAMFEANPHGAGYMVARDGKVEIHKGFMDFTEFWANVQSENFTDDDVTVFHCRISTQAGVNREMCHPFAFTSDIVKTKALDVTCKLGIAHNGIIKMTSNGNREYSDTAQFIANYLPHIVHKRKDLENPEVLEIIERLIESKMVLLDGSGYVATVGKWFTEDGGLMYSNTYFKPRTYNYYTPSKWHNAIYR